MKIDNLHTTYRNYSNFIKVTLQDPHNTASEEISFTIDVGSMPAKDYAYEGLEEVHCTEDDERVQAQHAGFTLNLNLKGNTGEVELAAAREWSNVLRYLYFYGFLPRAGLLLHASGVVRARMAYLFPGPSGAGKTTIVKNSLESGGILSDEVILVHLPQDGEPLMAYGTPFFSDWGRPGEMMAAPIKGLYFPNHSPRNRLIPLSPRETLSRLLPCVFTYTKWQPRLQKLLDLTARLACGVPGYAFHFQPSPDFWKLIDAS